MTPEDEEFNRIERESRIKQEYVRDIQKRMELYPKHTIHELMDELAVARMLIRELGDRLAKLEQAQEPVGRFSKFTDGVWKEVTATSAGQPLYAAPPQRQWVGLTDEETNTEAVKEEQAYGFVQGALWAEAKLKEKNFA